MNLNNLEENQEPPEFARFELKLFKWRFGKLLEQDGDFVGITLEIYSTVLPWLKLRFPFLRSDARQFATTLTKLLDEESEITS